jgi:hypothetical protein
MECNYDHRCEGRGMVLIGELPVSLQMVELAELDDELLSVQFCRTDMFIIIGLRATQDCDILFCVLARDSKHRKG